MNKTIFVCLLLFTCAIAMCPAGSFIHGSRTGGYCSRCERGTYCPGDNSVHKCDGQSFAPKSGLSACIPCSRPSPDAKICMPEDTPKEVIYFDLVVNPLLDPQSEELVIDKPITVVSEYRGAVVFVASQSYDSDAVFTLYASSKTGNPSEQNHEYKSVGKNVSDLLIPSHNSYGDGNFSSVFFKIIPSKPTKGVLGQLSFNPLTYTLHHGDSPMPVYSGGPYNGEMAFIVRNEKKSKVVLTVKTNRDYGDNLGGFLYWSSNKQNKLPSRHDYTSSQPFKNGVFEFSVVDHGDIVISAFPEFKHEYTQFFFEVSASVHPLE